MPSGTRSAGRRRNAPRFTSSAIAICLLRGPLPRAGRLRARVSLAELHQTTRIDGLDHVCIEPGRARALHVLWRAVAADGDELQARVDATGAQAPRHLVAVQSRKAHVDEGDIGGELAGHLEGARTIGSRADGMVPELEQAAQHLSGVVVVLHDENAPRRAVIVDLPRG